MRKKVLKIIIVVVLIVVAGGGAAYGAYWLAGQNFNQNSSQEPTPTPAEQRAAEKFLSESKKE